MKRILAFALALILAAPGAAYAAGTPVFGADYQPAAASITARDVASSTGTGQANSSIYTGTPTAGSIASWIVPGMATGRITIAGTWTGTGSIEVSNDNTTWYGQTCHVQGSSSRGSTFTANGMFLCDIGAVRYLRVRSTAVMTGTITATATFSPVSDAIKVNNPISIGSATTGGCTPFHKLATASDNAALISAGAHTLCYLSTSNTTATVYYVKIYDKATTPAPSTDTPVLTIMVPASTSGTGNNPQMGAFGTAITLGLGIAIVANAADNDDTNAAVGIIANLGYN